MTLIPKCEKCKKDERLIGVDPCLCNDCLFSNLLKLHNVKSFNPFLLNSFDCEGNEVDSLRISRCA